MNTISGMGPPAGLQQLMRAGGPAQGGMPPMSAMAGGPDRAALQSIQGEDGQSLLDIRDQLQTAVQDAVQGFDGEGDLRSEVQGAIRSTLEENGFDVDEVRSAMESSFGSSRMSFDPSAMMSRGGADPMALLGGAGGASDSFVQSFLEQFRAGVNLDLEI